MDGDKALEQHGLYADKLENYFRIARGNIEGWAQPRLHQSLVAVQELHDLHQITGGTVEIGVHHGKFFLALGCLRRPDEPWLAVDLFEEQAQNIDGSGRGDLEKFNSNLLMVHGDCRPPAILKGDSTVLRQSDYRSALEGSDARLFSVDGGHTAEHAMNDLRIASELVCNGAVVFLDDFFNEFWPGVNEGFYRYMSVANTNLCPFAFCANKLFLTTLAYHRAYFEYFRNRFKTSEDQRVKRVKICGFDVLALRYGESLPKFMTQSR